MSRPRTVRGATHSTGRFGRSQSKNKKTRSRKSFDGGVARVKPQGRANWLLPSGRSALDKCARRRAVRKGAVR
eukprot:9498725-Pyramimonas_sp.AAC.1